MVVFTKQLTVCDVARTAFEQTICDSVPRLYGSPFECVIAQLPDKLPHHVLKLAFAQSVFSQSVSEKSPSGRVS
jgi:hypothetical protein